jgi:hypothetical protein
MTSRVSGRTADPSGDGPRAASPRRGLIPLGRILSAAAIGVLAMTSSSHAQGTSEGRQIVQALLDAPQLAQYYHFDVRPDRVPLKIVNRTETALDATGLTAAGKPTALSGEDDARALVITAFTIAGDVADLAFRFAVEGVAGKAAFKKSGGRWTIEALSVAER